MTTSPFAPDSYPENISIKGMRLIAYEGNLRYVNRPDLMLMLFDEGTNFAGVFTQVSICAAPIQLCKQHLKQNGGKVRALLVNAGSANAFTGKAGDQLCTACCDHLSKHFNIPHDQIMLASTGVIGVLPDQEKLADCIHIMADMAATSKSNHNQDWLEAAHAITTTDTYPKYLAESCMIDGVKVKLAGIAKGSGMIAPNMATMLGFIASDAKIAASLLQTLLKNAVDRSFNVISVDSDTSTNDCVMLAATGASDHPEITDYDDPKLQDFKTALNRLCLNLALQIIKDGEGITKFIEITVTGAHSDMDAEKIAKSIANSPLVKTAIAGGDANWGRIIMAIGKSGVVIDPDLLEISLGGVQITANGSAIAGFDEAAIDAHLTQDHILIGVALGLGAGAATIYGCDLTHGYIDINADYRS